MSGDHTMPRVYVTGPFRAASEYERRANIARAEATDWFQCRTCHRCARYLDADDDCDQRDAAGLSIIARTWLREIDEPGYPSEWVYGPDRMPTCTAWVARPAAGEGGKQP